MEQYVRDSCNFNKDLGECGCPIVEELKQYTYLLIRDRKPYMLKHEQKKAVKRVLFAAAKILTKRQKVIEKLTGNQNRAMFSTTVVVHNIKVLIRSSLDELMQKEGAKGPEVSKEARPRPAQNVPRRNGSSQPRGRGFKYTINRHAKLSVSRDNPPKDSSPSSPPRGPILVPISQTVVSFGLLSLQSAAGSSSSSGPSAGPSAGSSGGPSNVENGYDSDDLEIDKIASYLRSLNVDESDYDSDM